MPFCPSCRQEFESFASACPDCDVELTEALAPAAGGPSFELLLVVASDEETAEAMRTALAPSGIPVGAVAEDGPKLPGNAVGLLLPREFANQAIRMLDAHPELVRDALQLEEGEEPVLFFKRGDPSAAALDVEILSRPVAEIVARGQEAVVPLLEFVRIGDDVARDRAVRALRGFGDEGLVLLARHLAVLAREQREAAFYHVGRELRERLTDASALDDLIAVAADGSLETGARTLALHALGRLELKEVWRGIVPLLADADETVREEADEALCTLSDEDMGYEPDLDAAGIAAVQEKWTAWFSR